MAAACPSREQQTLRAEPERAERQADAKRHAGVKNEDVAEPVAIARPCACEAIA